MDVDHVKEKAHYIAVTGIVRNDLGKFLICKRGPNQRIFANKWCVPGGKVERSDFVDTVKDTNDHWFDVFEKALCREIEEETKISIGDIGYVSNLAMLRPDGFSSMIVSLHAKHAGGEVEVDGEELVDFAWVTLDEAKEYDLIENIWEQIEKVHLGL
jgi:8-oxo-dGTP pyrophosphatase MutT (NUDIX family)